jgi:hypothetical protein
MNTPDEIQLPTPEPAPVAEQPATVPETVVPATPVPPVAETAPAAAAAPAAPELPVASEPAAPPPKAPRAVRKPKPAISDETLAAWQAKLAAENAAKRRAARAALAARERAAAFRELRAALRRLEAEPAEPADDLAELRADRLAMDVHQAPERVRTVIAATLRMLSKRGR